MDLTVRYWTVLYKRRGLPAAMRGEGIPVATARTCGAADGAQGPPRRRSPRWRRETTPAFPQAWVVARHHDAI
ncbi:hypothetical protein MSG_01560 [Mycobacterium shigaense]|uniref:Uncharacterized protein n=1 Tax=Mycobacterium shigaense TaxID=722731 RepID=A0A1Z4EFJ5_9MYCO|nr:hypothetical protein MSG_01560 [Mycobacterium shigaense]